MKKLLLSFSVLAVLVVGAAFFATTAKAETVAYITQQTRILLHKRLAFAGYGYVKIGTVRCQTNGYDSWFCIVHESSPQTGPMTFDYVVTATANNLNWSMQK